MGMPTSAAAADAALYKQHRNLRYHSDRETSQPFAKSLLGDANRILHAGYFYSSIGKKMILESLDNSS